MGWVCLCVGVQGRLKKDFNWSAPPKRTISKSETKKKSVIYGVLLDSFSHKLITKSSFYLFEGLTPLNCLSMRYWEEPEEVIQYKYSWRSTPERVLWILMEDDELNKTEVQHIVPNMLCIWLHVKVCFEAMLSTCAHFYQHVRTPEHVYNPAPFIIVGVTPCHHSGTN